ncbi:MAG: inorganic diphosphatase [Gammaproteobacteria bacterium]
MAVEAGEEGTAAGEPRTGTRWVEVVIEVPRGGFVKRDAAGVVAYVSPLPCPFNYGAVPGWLGGEGDLLDAVVLGPRLPRGARVRVPVRAAVSMRDRGLIDDKLICSAVELGAREHRAVLTFFRFFALCKRALALVRGQGGATACLGWCDVADAFARASPTGERARRQAPR